MEAFPKYEVLQRTFIEPELLQPGSIIEFEGQPGPHLLPLNQEAHDMFEAWYSEEYPLFDKEGEPVFYMNEDGQRVQKMYRPHEVFRRVERPKVERARFNLVEGPPPPKAEDLNHTLAGLGLKQATPDVRPGPDRVRNEVFDPNADVPQNPPKMVVLKEGKAPPKRELGLKLAEEGQAGQRAVSAVASAVEND